MLKTSMTYIMPGELEPSQPILAPLSETDESFTRRFEAEPALNDFANASAVQFCDTIDRLLVGASLQPVTNPDTSSALHFQIKKLVFLFTDPEDFEDTITDHDVGLLFVGLFAQAHKDIDRVPALFSTCVQIADEIHIPNLKQNTLYWSELGQHARFWMVRGAASATAPDIPTQRQS